MSKKPPQNEQQIINTNKTINSEEAPATATQIEAARIEFELGVPEEKRKAFTAEFVAREFPHGILPPQRIVANLAAMAWHSQTRNATLAEAV